MAMNVLAESNFGAIKLLKLHLRREGLPEKIEAPAWHWFDAAVISVNTRPGEGIYRITWLFGSNNDHVHFQNIEDAIENWKFQIQEVEKAERRKAASYAVAVVVARRLRS